MKSSTSKLSNQTGGRAMRQIKFRAWDKTSDVMRTDISSIDYDSTGNICQINVITGTDILFPEKEAVLMQYTDLKDKNGVEIYEGDIVDCERHGFTTSIEYYGGAFRCRSEGVPLSLYIDECYADKDDNNQLEVIGNIYENPELLEAEL